VGLKESKVGIKKELSDVQSDLKQLEIDHKVGKIQMDWTNEDMDQYQTQNSKFTELII
jgi:hypothetical protein